MSISEIVNIIIAVLSVTFFVCYAYQFFYILVPFIKKPKPHLPAVPHKFGILISARNEKVVIKNLIDSIKKQTYDQNLITIFVIADNCTDETAEICRAAGAVVYERNEPNKIGKGYALEFLYENIVRDFGDTAFDAYFVLDADNVLDPRYVEKMNQTFSDGYQVVTSYRNSKNYGDNWISAGYALWFLRESKYLNNSRMLMNTTCAVSGTGFMFDSAIIREVGGWKFFLLTEDIEFTVYNVVKGRKIGYSDAELYDEQPTTFAQSWRQRMRWTKGYIQVWGKFGGSLLKNIFSPKFSSCYDMTMTILPAMILSLLGVTTAVVASIVAICMQQYWEILLVWKHFGSMLLGSYILLSLIATITVITEWKKIRTTKFKKIFYIFTFPLFMLTYIPITFCALFKKVEWKPIVHSKATTIDQLIADEPEEQAEEATESTNDNAEEANTASENENQNA